MDPPEEANKIQRARQGDLDAFNQLVLEYQALVYNHALWLVQDHDTAEDLTQETFISAFQNLNQYRGGSFRAWLMRIVAYDSIDELRRQKRRKIISLTRFNEYEEEIEPNAWLRDPVPSVEEKAEQDDLRDNMQKMINELPEEYRRTVVLVDLLEMQYAEAAAAMNVPIGTVKSRLARARMVLQKRLKGAARLFADTALEPA
jgi:RNA polymerase sigma-70 factor (ECF subfamily)